MEIVKDAKQMKEFMELELKKGRKIGYVPTMGCLHQGHLALLKQAWRENDTVVCSIFVNPTQFGENEDFDEYPRDIDNDAALAAQNSVDYLFCPSIEEIYGDKVELMNIDLAGMDKVLCGKTRPNHFQGVATVLMKLFGIITPSTVYFGQKDAQQVCVVKKLLDEHFPNTRLETIETVRESDRLAISSRNQYLTEEERAEARMVYQTLNHTRYLMIKDFSIKEALACGVAFFHEKVKLGKLEYLEAYSYPSLKPVTLDDKVILVAIAVKYSKARLIDNVVYEL